MFHKTQKIAVMVVVLLACSYGVTAFAYNPPVAHAGPDLSINSYQYNANATTVLQGTGYDPNGGSLTYSWYCKDGGLLSDPNIAQPTFTVPAGLGKSTSFHCMLTVQDSFGLSANDQMVVNVNINNGYQLSTEPATNIQNNQATLNGFLHGINQKNSNFVWFQWGIDSNYVSESYHNTINADGNFSQVITGLYPNTTYHFRAISQQNNGNIAYGKDMTFFNNTPNTGVVLALASNGAAGPATSGNPTNVSTGLTNNFLTDSFFLPLLIALIGTWMFMSGMFADIEEWFYNKKSKQRTIRAQAILENKIAKIKDTENVR